MKAKEIRELPDDEIEAEVAKRRKAMFQQRLRAGGEGMEKSGARRQMRRDIARMLTILAERRRARESAS
ncbi:MAG: 50S ribosomal protein L29 [Planctomycetes bacterium]|nr:50S ribosomal protein L29 [Planctomycetota bacterium]